MEGDCTMTESKMESNDVPFSSLKRVHINDVTLILAPRIKIDYSFGRAFGWKDCIHPTSLKSILNNIFITRTHFPQPFKLPYDDIKVTILLPHEKSASDDNYVAFAKGSFFFRFSYTRPKEGLVTVRNNLVKKLNGLVVTYNDVPYELRVSVDIGEDAQKMLANAGLSKEPPAITVKGFPLQWFAKEPDSDPSEELLRIFFESFGSVRTLNVIDDIISVQYNSFDDLQEALNSLCSCSLQKEGEKERIEYSVMLKEMCEDAEGKKRKSENPSSVRPLKRYDTRDKVIDQAGAASRSSSSTCKSLGIKPLPGLEVIFKELLQEEGISDIRIIGEGYANSVVLKDLQLWLSNAPPMDNHFTLLARAGKQVQEIELTTTLDREGIRRAVQRVFEGVP